MPQVMSVDPRTLEAAAVGREETSQEELDTLVASATAGQKALGALAPNDRAAVLRAICASLEADRAAIVTDANRETALGTARLEGELDRVIHQFGLFADVLEDGAYLEVMIDRPDPAASQPEIRRMLMPLGTVAVFGASNFPLAFSVAGGDTASALAAGCSVIAKAHPSHPMTSLRTADAIRAGLKAAGQSPDCLGLIFGTEAGRRLVEHDLTRAVGFTGSLAGGRALHDIASARPDPIPFYGELGSLNPVVVTPSAASDRLDEIAAGFVGSFTLGVGQFCTKPGLIFVPSGHATRFVDTAVSLLEDDSGGFLLNEATNHSYLAHLKSISESGCLVTGPSTAGHDMTSTETRPALAFVTDIKTLSTTPLLGDECFGPFAIVVSYDTVDDVIQAVAALPNTLTASVHCTDDDPDGPPLLAALSAKAGRVVWNGFPTGVRVSWAMHHGGQYPASTSPLHTSVGATAIRRWLRPVAYQGLPDALLPHALRDANPLGLPRRIDGSIRH